MFDVSSVNNADVERLLHPNLEELAGLTNTITTLRTAHRTRPADEDVTFQLAAALVSHARRSYIEEGLDLLEAMVTARWGRRWRYYTLGGETSDASRAEEGYVHGVPVTLATAPSPSDEDEVPGSALHHDVTGEASGSTRGLRRRAGASSLNDPPASFLSSPTHNTIAPGELSDLVFYRYYMALGCIKLGDNDRAAAYLEQLLSMAPNNHQAIALREYIEGEQRRVRTESAVALGVGVGIAALGVLWALRRLHRKRT